MEGRATATERSFAVGQVVEVSGLQSRPELNGQLGTVLDGATNGRYPVAMERASEASDAQRECVRLKPASLSRTDSSPREGEVDRVTGRCMLGGEWLDLNALLDATANATPTAAASFKSLGPLEQADVLAGRTTLGEPVDPTLPPGCPRRDWLGSGGDGCDGCGATAAQLRRLEEPIEAVCSRCAYGVCGECAVHHSRGTCHCKDSNFGRIYPPPDSEHRMWYHGGRW